VANLVLMGQNVSYQQQLKDLTQALKDLSDNDLLLATDQEGGVVARIPWDSARLISYKHIGIVNRDDFAYEAGEDHATVLDEYGVDMNLAPVLDTLLDNGSPMYSRMFSSDADVVSNLGQQMIKAHQDYDIISTAKHFPGIGRTNLDTHTTLPTIDVSKEELQQTELIPFQAAINSNVEAIMVGHALYPQVDDKYPSSLSKVFVTDILRDEMMFEGVILTDDIHMGALNDYPDKVTDAVNAGNDILLLVDSYENQVDAIEQLKEAVEKGDIEESRINESVKRILRLKMKYNVGDQEQL
jgi:beta-N-acetylhexosaminidase